MRGRLNLEVFEIPWDICPAHRRVVFNGRAFLEPEYKKFMERTIRLLVKQKPHDWQNDRKFNIRVALGSNNYRGDLDNYLKGVLDALVKSGVLKDDSQKYVQSIVISTYDGEDLTTTKIWLHWE